MLDPVDAATTRLPVRMRVRYQPAAKWAFGLDWWIWSWSSLRAALLGSASESSGVPEAQEE